MKTMRFLLSFFFIALPPLAALAQSQLPVCPASIAASSWHNCFGTSTYPSGNKYAGEFKDGQRHGQGTYTFASGDLYVGEHKDGKSNGSGVYTHANGNKYVGEHKDGQRHGQGTYTFASGDVHTGAYKEGKFNGPGTYTHATGNKYVGEYRDNKREGQGILTFANGDKYVGEFKEGKVSGMGTFTFASGSKYEGAFKDGLRHGMGTYSFVNGSKYVGEYKDDKTNGQGIEYFANGTIRRQGRWGNGELLESFALDAQRFPFHPSTSTMAAVPLAPVPETDKSDRERLATALEASRKKQQDLQERLELAQVKPVVPSNLTERRVALVVGNASYKNSPLTNPVNDAVDISDTLKGLGFQVTTLQNANLRKLREATRLFEGSVASADVALIFYAGHAVEAKGRNFVIPVDADVAREYELDDQAYDAQQWLAMLGDTKGRNTQRVNIVILDACRDNPVSRQWRSASSGLGRMDAPSGTLLVYSTAPGKVASDGPKGQRNSPFTKSLLKSMQTPNLPVEQVLKEVRRQVLAETKGEQVPWENSSLIGDFVFKRQR